MKELKAAVQGRRHESRVTACGMLLTGAGSTEQGLLLLWHMVVFQSFLKYQVLLRTAQFTRVKKNHVNVYLKQKDD